MSAAKKKRIMAGYVILTAALCLLMFINLVKGSVSMEVSDVLGAFYGSGETAMVHIIRDIRVPRILAACLLGGALALSGYLLQVFFDNPIAGPFVLGISSGAKLLVAFVMIASLESGFVLGSVHLIAAAFAGAMMVMGFILLISSRAHHMSVLIICGVMIGYLCSAATEFAVTFADDANIVNLHNWSMGSFSGISMENVRIFSVLIIILTVAAFLLAKPIAALRLGETYAANMGINVRRFRAELILISSFLAAIVTAFAGPVSFVGIAVPHLIRRLFRTSSPIVVIPAVFMGGSVFCLLCDLIARSVFAPVEMSISAVTSIIGAPIVIWIMLQRRKRG